MNLLQTALRNCGRKLVLQSVPLVHYLLARMGITQEMGTDYEDLAHQGLMGLIEAVDHFDPEFNAQFSTYASLRIRGKILDYLRTSDWMPRAARKRSRMIQKSITTLWSENPREPTEEEIASHLGTTWRRSSRDWLIRIGCLVSLDMMMECDGEGECARCTKNMRDENQVNPLDMLEEEDLIERNGRLPSRIFLNASS